MSVQEEHFTYQETPPRRPRLQLLAGRNHSDLSSTSRRVVDSVGADSSCGKEAEGLALASPAGGKGRLPIHGRLNDGQVSVIDKVEVYNLRLCDISSYWWS